MLYVSTRDNTNTYTAHRALIEQAASDGGMFVPFRLPSFSQEEILQMKSNSFGNNVAQILNAFFSVQLSGWDVDFCCGRNPVSIVSQPRKLLIAELWHNTESTFAHIEQALYHKLCSGNSPEKISTWARIAIRIAIFFAIYASMIQDDKLDPLDLALDDSDFIAPMAAWYARKMGLPIDWIICGSCDNGEVWDLLHRGEMSTAACDENLGIEQLIFNALGAEEAKRFVAACQKRRSYQVDEELQGDFNDRMFVAVASSSRIENVISSFRRSNSYELDASAAIGFGALQDYRARFGESRTTMLFSMYHDTATSK